MLFHYPLPHYQAVRANNNFFLIGSCLFDGVRVWAAAHSNVSLLRFYSRATFLPATTSNQINVLIQLNENAHTHAKHCRTCIWSRDRNKPPFRFVCISTPFIISMPMPVCLPEYPGYCPTHSTRSIFALDTHSSVKM